MDWTQAIARNHAALTRIVAALFALLGLAAGGVVQRVSKAVSAQVLRVLLPAESAVRRLIFIAAQGLVVKDRPARAMPPAFSLARTGKTSARGAFQLFDPRQQFDVPAPDPAPKPKLLHLVNVYAAGPLVPLFRRRPETPAAQPDDGLVSGLGLSRRLAAVQAALADLPRQARRLARWRARQTKKSNPNLISPIRPGKPPGKRKVPDHEVDDILINCHALAFDARAANTS